MNEEQLNTIHAYDKSAEQFVASIAKLTNYNHTYDFLIEKLNTGDTILDLACGPAQISKYITDKISVNVVGVDLSEKMLEQAKKNVPNGNFYKHTLQDFQSIKKFDSVIIGFGIPYLDKIQTYECLRNAISLIKSGKYLYISFMQGNKSGYEKTSFGGDNQFFIYYHDKSRMRKLIRGCGLTITKEYNIDYTEPNGEVTEDVIIIAQKQNISNKLLVS